MKKQECDLDVMYRLHDALGSGIAAMEENERLRIEAKEWRTKYTALLNDSLKHGETMMGNMLLMAIRGPGASVDKVS